MGQHSAKPRFEPDRLYRGRYTYFANDQGLIYEALPVADYAFDLIADGLHA